VYGAFRPRFANARARCSSPWRAAGEVPGDHRGIGRRSGIIFFGASILPDVGETAEVQIGEVQQLNRSRFRLHV